VLGSTYPSDRIFEDFGGQETPVVFPERILHEKMQDQIPYTRVLSAGEVTLQDGEFVCSGRVKSLHTQARPQNGSALAAHFTPDLIS
jgi:hypothetical protein